MDDRRRIQFEARLHLAITQREAHDAARCTLDMPTPVVAVCRGSGRCMIDSIVDYGFPMLPRTCPFCVMVQPAQRHGDVAAIVAVELGN